MSAAKVWLVAFLKTDGTPGDVYVFPTKREAFAAKDEWEREWEREWVSGEPCVVYRASLWKASR